MPSGDGDHNNLLWLLTIKDGKEEAGGIVERRDLRHDGEAEHGGRGVGIGG